MHAYSTLFIFLWSIFNRKTKLSLIYLISRGLAQFEYKSKDLRPKRAKSTKQSLRVQFIKKPKIPQMSQSLILDEFIIHYQRKQKQKCEICSASFKFANAQHICKRCCRSVCTDCSPYKVKCYMANYKNNLHRMCRKCNLESEVLQKYVKTHRLKWGEDSDLVRLWLRQLGIKSVPKKRNSQKKKAKPALTFSQIWKSLNFSFRQFLGIVIDQSKIPQLEIVELVNLCLGELSAHKLANLNHLVYIVLFFLAHCNANNAIYFTTVIVQLVYTQEVALDNVHYFLEQLGCSQMEVYKMESILEEVVDKIIKRCTINVFTAELSIEIMSMLMAKRDYEELEKGIAFVFAQRKEYICQNSNKPEDIVLDILRNTTSANYRKKVKDIDRENSVGSETYSPENKSVYSEKSDTESNISSPSRRSVNLKKQNQTLTAKVRQQENQLQILRKQLEQYRSSPTVSAKSSKDEKKTNQPTNIFGISISEITMSKDKTKEKYDQSTSEENDETNFNKVIYRKNEQIIQLKKQLERAKDSLSQVLAQQKLGGGSDREGATTPIAERKMLKDRDEQIEKLKAEGESLKNTNKRLFMKLNQLTNLLMDKEEKNIKEANKFFQELSKEEEQVRKDKQCKIY